MVDAPERSDRHVSSFDVEALRLGVASDAERAWIEEHVRRCPRCAELARSIESWRDEFAADVLPQLRSAVLRRKPSRPAPALWIGALLVSAAAVLLFFVGPRRPAEPPSDELSRNDSEIVAKGGPSLLVVARRAGRVFPVKASAKLRSGDEIRFVLQNTTYPFVLVGSIDGAGHANLYVPFEGVESARFEPAERIEVPGSIVMDASPGPERLFALFSRRPLQASAVRAALAAIGARGADAIRAAERLDVGADAEATVLVEKEAP